MLAAMPARTVDGGRPGSVLLVEDDASLRFILRRNLQARGYDVREAETVVQALAAVVSHPPAVLLLDINLPDGSGWDLLRALDAQSERVPTVVLSALPVSRAHLHECRPDAYLPKPFPLADLLAAVERLTHAPAASVREDERA
jgi:DNA-binding response OmpR family regulator